jgi:Ca2+-binding RTX toxin-like protein
MHRRRFGLVSLLASLLFSLVAVPAAQAAPVCLGKRATIVGTQEGEELVGTPRADVIVGRGGNDLIRGRGGGDRICGKDGSDDLRGGRGPDAIEGGGDPDALTGGPGDDRLTSGRGPFHLFWPGRGDDIARGGPTTDFIIYDFADRGVTVDLGAGTSTGEGSDTLRAMDGVQGSPFDDTLRGDDSSNLLQGGRGDDTIRGMGNPDGIFSPDFLLGHRGDDDLDGGDGHDLASYVTANHGVTVNLAVGTATGQGDDTLAGIEGLEGSPQSDTLTGDGADNTFFGLNGDDTISGGAGTDAVFYSRRAVTVDLGAGMASGEGVDTLAGLEDIYGSPGPDDLTGEAGRNVIRGRGGDDAIAGLAGDDELLGGDGTDTVDGGADTDACAGETESNCESDPTAVRMPQASRVMIQYLVSRDRLHPQD